MLEPTCRQFDSWGFIFLFLVLFFAVTIISIYQKRRILLLLMIDQFQFISLLLYLNVSYSYISEPLLIFMNYFNLNNILPNIRPFVSNESKNDPYLYFTNEKAGYYDHQTASSKFMLFHKSANFIQNGTYIIIFHVCAWILVLLATLWERYRNPLVNTLAFRLQRLFKYTILIEVYFRTLQEAYLSIFLQFKNNNAKNPLNKAGLAMSLLFFFYSIIVMAWFIYQLNSLNQKAKIEQYNALYYKIDATQGLKRNYNLIMCARKVLTPLVMVTLFEYPKIALFFLVVIGISSLVGNIIIQPHFGTDYNIMINVFEGLNTFIFVMCLFYEGLILKKTAKNFFGVMVSLSLLTHLILIYVYTLWQFRKFYIQYRLGQTHIQKRMPVHIKFFSQIVNKGQKITHVHNKPDQADSNDQLD